MKILWAGAFALVLSTAVYAKVADTVMDMPKFETLAVIYKSSSPQALITVAASPLERGVLTEYVRLHNTRLENPHQIWLAGSGLQ